MLNKSTFSIPKMDCASEEQLVKMSLESIEGIRNISFDLTTRKISVVHSTDALKILSALKPLRFGAELDSTLQVEDVPEMNHTPSSSTDADESKVLKQLLAINGAMFIFELVAGLFGRSTGLIADSLDMFADAAVYGISLYAVGRSMGYKKTAAKFSGYMQVALSIMVMFEVVRRFFEGGEPSVPLMVVISFIALVANVTCLLLISKHRKGAVHMRASWIFSTNDVIANFGVILAAGLVYVTKSPWPDLIVGAIISMVVFSGALKILKLSRAS